MNTSRTCVSSESFSKVVQEWLDEDCSDVDSCDDNTVIHSDHISDSENSENDEEVVVSVVNDETESDRVSVSSAECDDDVVQPRYYYGKNRYKWSSKPSVPKRSRTLKHNILKLPSLRRAAQIGNEADPISIWNLLITDDIVGVILQWTNEKLTRERSKCKSQTDMRNTDITELKALFGLLFYSAAFKSNHESTKAMFATDGTGREIFRCVMSKNRFETLLSNLRFDNPDDRSKRKELDPTAAISDVFGKFVRNCQSAFSIGSSACIDEMLVSFRGRCKFKMYMPSKPCKYGLKLMCLTDARNNYFYNGYIYCGKDSDGSTLSAEERRLSKPTQAVLRLSAPLYGSNRNITADNWFGSIEVVKCLKEKNLTYVGTLKKNKREIPPAFLPSKSREIGSSLFAFTRDITLVSQVTKKGRAVILVSSMHHDRAIDSETNKSEITMYYNCTKGGVDALDEKCVVYCTGRRTRRWPMAIFYRVLDISAVNAFVMYNAFKDNPVTTRLDFMLDLASSLVKQQMERRVTDFHLTFELRACIRRVMGKPEEKPQPSSEKLEKRKTCYLCDPKKKRKTSYLCYGCKKPICLECANKMCVQCTQH